MIVAFTVNNRPNYLRRTLESWSRVRGIESADLLFSCEPGCGEAVQLCRSVTFASTVAVIVHPQRQGVLTNPWEALDRAFDSHDFGVLAEDDMEVSPDVLEYFGYCQRYKPDAKVLGVTTYQRTEKPGGLAGVRDADWDTPDCAGLWVWGTWKSRWKHALRDSWDKTYEENGGGPLQRGWDWKIRNTFCADGTWRMKAPSLARSQHIGRYNGTHATPAQFAGLASKCFAGSDVPPQHYQEVSLWHTTREFSSDQARSQAEPDTTCIPTPPTRLPCRGSWRR